jgi:RNA recognition motif-containing protein
MSNKVYVGNMSYRTNEEGLRNLFSNFGEVSSVTVIHDRETGRSKGFGFVEMVDSEAAQAAISALNDRDFEGRRLKVNLALPKGESAPRQRPFRSRDRY